MVSNPQYLQRHEIDTTKWDHCISKAENGLLYAHSWWLDTMADNWCGLVWNDYEAVMPLTWRQKFGIQYLYQPWFTPSLGMFQQVNSAACFEDFLQAIPRQFRYWDVDVNESNRCLPGKVSKLHIRERTNLIIPTEEYATVRNTYSRLARRSITKAIDHGVTIAEDDIEKIVSNYQQHYQSEHPAILDSDYKKLVTAGQLAAAKGKATAYIAMQKNDAIGFYLALHDDRFTYSLLGGTTPAGKQAAAFYLLTDHIIQNAMANNRSFRFEGSDIPGVAFFNGQFGPRRVGYLHLLRNNLPFPLNMLK